MTQNARVARWIPTVDPDEIGDGIVTLNPPTPNKSIDTKFVLGGGGGGGGLGDAPSDGLQYGRQDAEWTPVISGAGPATGVTVTPVGGISSTNVQLALAELDSEKVAKSGDVMTGHLALPTAPAANQAVRRDYVDTAVATIDLSLYAPKASPTFTGDPKAPTPTPGDNDTSIATTAFVTAADAAITSAYQAADALKAPIASPTFTGDPKAPTPSANDNDTSIATTAFVQSEISSKAVPPATVNPVMDGTAAVGVATKYAREDHVHPTDTTRVAKAGDTMGGALNFVAASHWAHSGPAGAGSYYSTNVTVDRFFVGTDASTDSFRIYCSGITANAFQVDGPTGKVSVAADPTAALGVATKQYVDTKAPAIATTAEFLNNTANRMLTTDKVWAAAAPVQLTDAATVTPDFALGIDFFWVLGAAGRTLANPTNMKVGQKGVIYLFQDATGGRTITTWGTYFKFPGGTKPILTAAANAVDTISYVVYNSTYIFCSAAADFK